MPEGDTIARAAASLTRWLVGRTITRVDARDLALKRRAEALVGRPIDGVEARAKHLLITAGDLVVHSHMRMTGSWHVYTTGETWRKRRDAMRFVLEAGDHQAVCFSAPVLNVVPVRDLEVAVRGVATLGPDILKDIDAEAAVVRFDRVDPATPIGDVLLDQTVVSGLGNIWRCETLFANRVHPATPVGALDGPTRVGLIVAAAKLMTQSVAPNQARPRPTVYQRSGQPCFVCSTPITAQRMGRDLRTAYFCPNCQKKSAESSTA